MMCPHALTLACRFFYSFNGEVSSGAHSVDKFEHVLGMSDVERRGGFVEKQNVGLLHEGSSEDHALCLPAE